MNINKKLFKGTNTSGYECLSDVVSEFIKQEDKESLCELQEEIGKLVINLQSVIEKSNRAMIYMVETHEILFKGIERSTEHTFVEIAFFVENCIKEGDQKLPSLIKEDLIIIQKNLQNIVETM